MTDYWFFLSYARRNDRSRALPTDDDKSTKLIRRLYEDLAAEIISGGVTQATKLDEVGFFDQTGIEPGDKWDDTVADALRTTRVMLCLFTRSYFNSRVCGQEFEVFRRRVRRYADANNGRHAPLIIPVLWHRVDRLPALPRPSSISSTPMTTSTTSTRAKASSMSCVSRSTRTTTSSS